MDELNISVSDWVNSELEKIKERDGHSSKDSVIRTLILTKGVIVYCKADSCVDCVRAQCNASIINLSGCESFRRKSGSQPCVVKVSTVEVET